jgi:LPPG:FO 2-phospho-L-lactate transferase
MIVALAGGVGGAKLAQGLMLAVPAETLSVVVNTADDFELFGLHISPDLDTVMYTLAGVANTETGWGIAADTFDALDMLARYGQDPWFRLGDRDFATHILRTQRLRAGQTLTAVTTELASALGVRSRLLPMSDDPVATMVVTPEGELAFQDYFVKRRQADDVTGVRFVGMASARISREVRVACREVDVIVLCPSNPIVSIGPILGVPGMRDALAQATAPIVAVSPLVGGRALKGPADRMLASLGHEVSALGVSRLYAGLARGMVIDHVDSDQRAPIEALGMRVLVTDIVMGGAGDRQRLAQEVLAFARDMGDEASSAKGPVL